MRFKRWPIYSVLAVLLILSLAPLATEWYIEYKLQKRGYQVEMNSVGLNLFTGRVALNNFNLTDSKGGRFKALEAKAKVDILSLLQGDVLIKNVEIEGGVFDLSTQLDSVTVGGFDFNDVRYFLGEAFALTVARIQLNNTEVCIDSKKQCLHLESLITGRIDLRYSANEWTFSHVAPLDISKLFLKDLSNDSTSFYLDKLEVLSSSYSNNRYQANGVHLKNVQLIQSFPGDSVQAISLWQTQMGELQLSHISYQGGEKPALLLGELSLVSPRQSLSRKQGTAQVPFNAKETLASFYEDVARSLAGSNNLNFAIQKFSVQGGVISFQDKLAHRLSQEQLTSIQMHLGPLDTATKVATDTVFSAKLGERGLVKFTGKTYPFGPLPVVIGHVKIQDWDLSNIAGYTSKLFNQQVNEGVVDVSFDVELQDDHLLVTSDWQFSQFVFDDDSLNSSLSQSLNLLKDYNKSVQFTLPISSENASKNVSLNYIFGDLVASTLKKLSQSQLEGGSELPNGDGLILGSSRSEKRVFRSILFQSNTREPEADDVKRLWDIAEILKSKPHLIVNFCPVSTAGEWAEIFNNGIRPGEGFELRDDEMQALEDLSSARGKYLVQDLMDQGVSSTQIKVCQPTVDMTKLGLPFATVSM